MGMLLNVNHIFNADKLIKRRTADYQKWKINENYKVMVYVFGKKYWNKNW